MNPPPHDGRHRVRAVRLGVALAAVLAFAAPVQALTFGPTVPVTDVPDIQSLGTVNLAVGGSVLHAEYERGTDPYASTGFWYNRSTDTGASWGGATQLVGAAAAPDTLANGFVADGSTVIALFRRTDPDFTRRLYIRRSTDAGVHWGAEQLLASNTHTTTLGWGSVAVSGKLVVVAWAELRAHKVRIRRSTDGGATFKPAVVIATYGSGDAFPRVAASGKHVYVTWGNNAVGDTAEESGLRMRRSTDGAATFKPVKTIDPGLFYPLVSLAASGSRLLALYDGPNRAIRLARSTDGGATIHRSVIASGHLPSYRNTGGIAISGLEARLTWEDNGLVVTRSSSDGGATWAAAQTLFTAAQFGSSPRIGLVQGHTVVLLYYAEQIVSRAT